MRNSDLALGIGAGIVLILFSSMNSSLNSGLSLGAELQKTYTWLPEGFKFPVITILIIMAVITLFLAFISSDKTRGGYIK